MQSLNVYRENLQAAERNGHFVPRRGNLARGELQAHIPTAVGVRHSMTYGMQAHAISRTSIFISLNRQPLLSFGHV
jgi:hypothetical protein